MKRKAQETPVCKQQKTNKQKTPLSEAKARMRTTYSSDIVGRSSELDAIRSFLARSTKTGGTLYISGCPGTGKTACVEKLLKELSLKSLFINCTGLKSVCDKITPQKVIILDEIDHLPVKELYKTFELAKNEKKTLIGIANALDLTDRLLPRLKANAMEPELVHFCPYSQKEIEEIIRERLEEGGVVEQKAIELCARKIAAGTGDLRRALDLCRLAVDLADKENGEKVTMSHVLKVIGNVFGSPTVEKIKQLNVNQQIALIVLSGLTTKELILPKAYDAYAKFAFSKNVLSGCLSRNEFYDLLAALESHGLLSIVSHKNELKRQMTLNFQKQELTTALTGNVALELYL